MRFGRLCFLVIWSSLFFSRPPQQTAPPDRRFGAVEAFADPAAAAEARVGWERILFYWSQLQPNGPSEWNGYHVPDEWLNQAAAAGREVVGLLKNTPTWATDGLLNCGVPRGLDLPVDDPGNLWATFVRQIVQKYVGRVNHWIIWNEPDIAPGIYGVEWCGSVEEYYRLLQVAYLAAHQANPDVVIHLAGLTFWHDREYMRKFLQVATQDPTGAENGYYFDVVSLHIYFQTDSVPYIINETRLALSVYGVSKPIWVNETDASPDSDPLWPLVRPAWRVSLEEQAGFLLQSFALSLASGVERIAVYKWVDAGLPPGGEPFGVMRPDLSRRPAYEAFRLITTYYAGTQSARESRKSLYYLVTLNRGGGTTRVLWARTAAATTVTLSALAQEGLLITQTGEQQTVYPVDGQYTLTLAGARCADALGCIIGGPTVLLVEGEASSLPMPDGPTETPATPATPSTSSPTPSPALTETATASPIAETSPSPTPTAATPSPSATATPSPTPMATPSPTPTPTPTRTPSPTATMTPTRSPTPTHTPTAPPPPAVQPSTASPSFALVVLLFVLLFVVGVIVQRVRGRTD